LGSCFFFRACCKTFLPDSAVGPVSEVGGSRRSAVDASFFVPALPYTVQPTSGAVSVESAHYPSHPLQDGRVETACICPIFVNDGGGQRRGQRPQTSNQLLLATESGK
jgi:hypothetical protein